MAFPRLFLACCFILAFPQVAAARMVISEVLWAGSVVSAADEWVEVTCEESKESEDAEESEENSSAGILPRSDADVCPLDLGGWTILSRNSAGADIVMFTFPDGTMIEEGEYVVISNYAAGDSALSIEPRFVTTAVSLPNTALRLTLKDAAGNTVDTVDDGSGAPFAGRSSEPKASMERIDLFVSGESATNWKTAERSIHFDEGVAVMGSPGVGIQDFGESSESSESGEVSFSSISSCHAPAEGCSGITDISSSSSSISSCHAPAEGCSEITDISSSSSISYELRASMPALDISSASSASSSSSASSASSSSSSSSASSASSASLLRISEVLPNPVGTDDREWIEIQNMGTTEANIAGWKIKRGTAVYVLPNLTASGYLVEAGGFRIFYKFESKLTLPNDGGLVELSDASGILVDSFLYNGGGEGVSSGRDATGNRTAYCVPTPLAMNVVTAFDPKIEIQSGRSTDYDDVTLNLNATANASLTDAKCLWDFGDEETSESCNPSSHTWSEYGVYRVKLTAVSACGEEVERELEVVVLKKKEAKESEESKEAKESEVSEEAKEAKESKEAKEASSASSVSSASCVVSSSTGFIISSVFPSPDANQDEWIELRNVTSIPLDLCGWLLDDIVDGGSKPWKISSSLIMEPGNTRRFLGSETRIALNNGGDDVRLLNAFGEIADMLTYKNAKKGSVISSRPPAADVSRNDNDASAADVSRNEQKNYTTNMASGLIGSVVKSLNIRYEGRGFSSSSSVITLEELPEEYREVFGSTEMEEEHKVISDTNFIVPWVFLITQSIAVTAYLAWNGFLFRL